MSQLNKDADELDLVASPSTENLQTIRQFILSREDYDPASDELRNLDRMVRERQFTAALDESEALRDVWQLSPKFHFLVGNAALECGELDLVAESQRLFQNCLEFLLESGDGSREEPYEITYYSDTHDILAILDVDIRNQQIVNCDGRFFDVITLHDGQDIWFDIDPLTKKLSPVCHERANTVA